MANTDFISNGYCVVNGAVSDDVAKLVATEFGIVRDAIYCANGRDPSVVGFANDDLVQQSFSWYAVAGAESLLQLLQPKMEEITGKQLLPTYSYGRIYYAGASMPKHVDRDSCEYSATLTLDTDGNEPWHIWMTDAAGSSSALALPVGSMCVYKGRELEHWRDTFTGTKQTQVFIHYVDANGPFAHLKFDGRPMLGFAAQRG